MFMVWFIIIWFKLVIVLEKEVVECGGRLRYFTRGGCFGFFWFCVLVSF